jgi:uncharacterized membrane protein YeaQ/YmgE (transglycosylase-associated protein family)
MNGVKPNGYPALGLWLLWLGANLIPWLLVSAVVFLLGRRLEDNRDLLTLVAAAVLIAYVQSLVLEQLTDSRRGWITATLIGVVLAASGTASLTRKAYDLRITPSTVRAFLCFVGAVSGAILGIAQFLWLKRRARNTGWWIAASAASWGSFAVVTNWHLPVPRYWRCRY